MIEALDATGARLIGYLIVAATGLVAYFRERRTVESGAIDLRPFFNVVVSVAVLAIFVVRWRDFDDRLADFWRNQALAEGWYRSSRRVIQAAAVLGVVSLWILITGLSAWRVGNRARRYVPATMLLLAMVTFDVIRSVSFHELDTLLYRRRVGGFRIVTLVEFGLQAALAVALLRHSVGVEDDPTAAIEPASLDL